MSRDSKEKAESTIPNPKSNSNVRLDSNGDEIIWELEKKINILNVLWSWGILIIFVLAMFFVFILLPLKYGLNIKTFVILIIGILAIIAILYDIFYQTLNIQKIYATKHYLTIKRLLNKDIKIPLGSFYIRLTSEPSPFILDTIGCFNFVSIISLQEQKTLYRFILPSVNPLKSTNFNLLEQIITPKIEAYLISVSQDNYKKITLKEHPEVIGSKINFNKIEKLRKEKNGK
ncbi:hypothetical protein HPU229334_02075 [Helicobacter pullorum]|uniref:DUF304 domain-containing protein n=1 Tax=Helicobacter pullorum TaxID=35818 RepID=A0A0N1E5P9_9HELI|nr:hypothetical protein [Helicobacter pullorum]KPH49670.1 hypothetical protein HPU229254_00430 [Helicobacter pullorum]KPH52305.1 hypothetical protein HPU229334_02075 [Helicobacter pullorum]